MPAPAMRFRRDCVNTQGPKLAALIGFKQFAQDDDR